MLFSGKVAIITGAARGIGRACAERFAREGAKVVVADIDQARGQETAAAIAGGGTETLFVACDVGDSVQVSALIAASVDAFGALDVLVNSAGVLHNSDFLDVTEQDFDRVLRVNLKGPLLVGQAVARQLIDQGRGGAIVNLSSVGAVLAAPFQAAYNVSKGGVAQLTRVMALSLAPHGIRVNAIGPGTIGTDMTNDLLEDDALRQRILSRTPLGRVGDPAEVAAVAVFLASDEASYITGQTVYCDGGRLPLNFTV
jgi:NAD(P)-dependent dehydrogenase (short-subunit alcohol dehydrogenase family)